MKAVILAGGFGTRISEETSVKPKPMIEIGGKPILWHILKIYSHHGVNDFIICCGYKGYLIKEYFANYFLHQSDVTFDMSKISLSSRKSDHTITYSKIGNNKYRIICYSPTSKIFSGSDGEILYIPTQISNDIAPKTVNFNLSNILISDVKMTNVVSPTFSDGFLTIENNITPVTNDDTYSTNERKN